MSLQELIAPRFEEAQLSMANHRKNTVGLYKAHLQASTGSSRANGKPTKKSMKHDSVQGEEEFGEVFLDMLGRVMLAKKGTCSDRVLRFVGGYVKYLNEKSESPKVNSLTLELICDQPLSRKSPTRLWRHVLLPDC